MSINITVDTWSCPTTVYAAVGALGHLPRITANTEIVLITDSQLVTHTDLIRGIEAAVPVVERVARGINVPDLEFLDDVLAATTRHPHCPIVACGGGAVLDMARISGLARIDPALTARLPAAIAAGGLFMWPAPRDQANPAICIPTTLGTAAEVSPVVIIRHQQHTLMVVSPALRPAVAIIDPGVTASLAPHQLTAGLVEPLARVLVPAVTGAPLLLQDGLAATLSRTLITLGEQAVTSTPDASWRLTAALASAQTHTAFLILGRSPFGHILWPLATQIMAATGETKARALQRLLPAWLVGIGEGSLGAAFGCRDRVVSILGGDPLLAAQRLAVWFGRTQSAAPVVAFDVEAVARQVEHIWQAGGLFLRDASAVEIRWLLSAATTPGTC